MVTVHKTSPLWALMILPNDFITLAARGSRPFSTKASEKGNHIFIMDDSIQNMKRFTLDCRAKLLHPKVYFRHRKIKNRGGEQETVCS